MLASSTLPAAPPSAGRADDPRAALRQWVDDGQDRLPLPGSGQTLQRWRALADVGRRDLALLKLVEGHTDALAILAELGGPAAPAGSRWGTWCAEPPAHRMTATPGPGDTVRLEGVKAWCSGADAVTHALLSAWLPDGQPCLVAIDMDQAGITIDGSAWQGLGMARCGTAQVQLDKVSGTRIGQPGDYTARAGFWHGGAGIAACWWGGCAGIADAVRQAAARRPAADAPYLHAHLGAIDVALAQTAALLRETAAAIDAAPDQAGGAQALRVRLAVEQAAEQILRDAGRALGPGPACEDVRLSRLMTDLPIFIRQSHAERDQRALAGLIEQEALAWTL